jgi:hypothetical protein
LWTWSNRRAWCFQCSFFMMSQLVILCWVSAWKEADVLHCQPSPVLAPSEPLELIWLFNGSAFTRSTNLHFNMFFSITAVIVVLLAFGSATFDNSRYDNVGDTALICDSHG